MTGKTMTSLFCGAGGLDIGFEQAGFKTVWANDFNKDACDTFSKWNPSATVVCGSIADVDFEKVPATDIISGGFPCFPAGTPVIVENGIKKIEQVKVGDKVLTHKGRYRAVNSIGHRDSASTIVLKDVCGHRVEATPHHPFYIKRNGLDPEWIEACHVREGDQWLFVKDNEWIEISACEGGRSNISVYNIEVDEDNSYTAYGIAVHNCQGFSLAGPRKVDDSRNSLYKHFVRMVDEKKPQAFVAENVKGLLTIGGSRDVADAILADFADKGYDVSLTLVNAADYGVPEDRMRIIMVGIRQDLNKHFYMPAPFAEKKTIADVLDKDAKVDPADVTYAAFSSRYMSRNRKRGWDEQSFTIPASAKQVSLWPGSPDMIKLDRDLWKFGDEDEPEDKKMTRRLSYKEAAAIQTFPENMEFCGNLESKYKQIGNAVPPQLGKVVAERLIEILDGLWEKGCDENFIEPLMTSWDSSK